MSLLLLFAGAGVAAIAGPATIVAFGVTHEGIRAATVTHQGIETATVTHEGIRAVVVKH